jgi:hypothetical protein
MMREATTVVVQVRGIVWALQGTERRGGVPELEEMVPEAAVA